MKATQFSTILLLGLAVAVNAFGSNDDRFLKKYAMMKIYESCFGANVVKQIRQEMKAACAKCAAPVEQPNHNVPPPAFAVRLPPSVAYMQSQNAPQYTRLGEASQDANQNNDIQQGQIMAGVGVPQVSSDQPNILDTEKLQQAIMAFRPQQAIQAYPQPGLGYRPAYNSPVYQPVAGPFFQPWGPQQYQVPFPQPYFQQQQYPFYGNRMSRDMDFKSKLEVLTSRTNGKVRNVTCVMQELGYLDQNLEPNYDNINERILNLSVSFELKSDIREGLQFCQKFAQCVPETKKDNSPLSRDLVKSMFFFRCYKHKKLEACVMQDVRDRFTNEEDLDTPETDTDFRSLSRVGRNLNSGSTAQPKSDDFEDQASAIYDFLYGGGESDFESFV